MKEIKLAISFLLGLGIMTVMVTTCKSCSPGWYSKSTSFPVLSLQLYSINLILDHHAGFATASAAVAKEFKTPVRVQRSAESENAFSKDKSANTSNSSSSNSSSSTPVSTKKKGSTVKTKTLIIPDRTPDNYTAPVSKEDSETSSSETDDSDSGSSSNKTFNMKAMERTLIVIAGIAVIIIFYVGIKICLVKKGKKLGRYGIIETSEMDLLDKVEDDEEDESEEEELFDINRHRRRPF